MTTTDTKAALLDCAQDLIQRVGVNAMSYNDLSLAVGIRKASVHYHFPKKEELIAALIVRCGQDHGALYREIARSPVTVMKKLEEVAAIFEESLRKGKICIAGMLAVEFATLSESLQDILKETINRSVDVIESIFIQGVADRTFDPSMDTNRAAHAFHDFLLGSQIIARCLKDPEHFRTSARLYLDLLS